MNIVRTVVVNITYVLVLSLSVYGMWNGPNMPNWELLLRAGGLLIAVNGGLWLFGKLVDRWAEKQPEQTSEEVKRWASFRDDMDKTLINSIAYSAGLIAVVQALESYERNPLIVASAFMIICFAGAIVSISFYKKNRLSIYRSGGLIVTGVAPFIPYAIAGELLKFKQFLISLIGCMILFYVGTLLDNRKPEPRDSRRQGPDTV